MDLEVVCGDLGDGRECWWLALALPSLGRRYSRVIGFTGAETCRASDRTSRDFGFAVSAGISDIAAAMFIVVIVDDQIPKGCEIR